jgi:hypothetical protein
LCPQSPCLLTSENVSILTLLLKSSL